MSTRKANRSSFLNLIVDYTVLFILIGFIVFMAMVSYMVEH